MHGIFTRQPSEKEKNCDENYFNGNSNWISTKFSTCSFDDKSHKNERKHPEQKSNHSKWNRWLHFRMNIWLQFEAILILNKKCENRNFKVQQQNVTYGARDVCVCTSHTGQICGCEFFSLIEYLVEYGEYFFLISLFGLLFDKFEILNSNDISLKHLVVLAHNSYIKGRKHTRKKNIEEKDKKKKLKRSSSNGSCLLWFR